MAIETTIETPYRTNVRPTRARASSRRVIVTGVISAVYVAAVVGLVANLVVSAQKTPRKAAPALISGPDTDDVGGGSSK